MTDEALRNHPNYSPDDHAYLKSTGWTDLEIFDRWEAERRAGKGPACWDDDESLLTLWRALARVDLD